MVDLLPELPDFDEEEIALQEEDEEIVRKKGNKADKRALKEENHAENQEENTDYADTGFENENPEDYLVDFAEAEFLQSGNDVEAEQEFALSGEDEESENIDLDLPQLQREKIKSRVL